MKSVTTLTILVALVGLAACAGDENPDTKAPLAAAEKPAAEKPAAAAPAPAASAPAADAAVDKIPILPDYKYYAGGPVLSKDAHGRFRIQRFNGEVQQPPSRGMIFGVKTDGDKLEYRVWANGKLIGFHRGIMRDKLFWKEYAEYYRDGKLVTKESIVNDDAARRSVHTTQDIDPQNGEVIRTKENFLSYLPPASPKDEDMQKMEEKPDAETAAPTDAAPSAPAAPSVPAVPTAPAAPGGAH